MQSLTFVMMMIMFVVVTMFMTVIVVMVVLVHYDLRWKVLVHLMGVVVVVFVDWHHNFNVNTIQIVLKYVWLV